MGNLFFVSGILNLHIIAENARDAAYKAQNVIDSLGSIGIDGCVIDANKSKGNEAS